MKANVQYNDFKGSASADISDALGNMGGDDLESIGRYFDLNEDRFKIVGLSIYGTSNFNLSLICVDKKKSTVQKEHIVSLYYDINNKKEILDILFKRLHIVLYKKFDDKYPNLNYDEELNFSNSQEAGE